MPRRAEPATSREEEQAVAASARRMDRSDTEASSSVQRARILASTSAAAARSAGERKRASRNLRSSGVMSVGSWGKGGGATASMAEWIPAA